MSLNLSDYQEHLERLDPHVKDTLEASFHEAARVMSPGALKNHIEGARALSELGRGAGLVLGYVQQMPLVCKEVGDEARVGLISAAQSDECHSPPPAETPTSPHQSAG